MKIVGIDASLTGTGVAIISEKQITTTIQSKLSGPARLIEIRELVREIVSGADIVVIEGYAYAMANQAHQIGELGGVLRTMFYEMGLKWVEVNPSLVKKYATGKGNAKKEEIAVAIYKRWGREFPTNDEADAFVLASIGQSLAGYHFDNLTAFQHEVIDQLQAGGKKAGAKKKSDGKKKQAKKVG